MKRQDKSPRKPTKLSWDRQTFRKRIQNNDSEGDPRSQENNGENSRNIYQRPTRTTEQTEMNKIPEGISSRKIGRRTDKRPRGQNGRNHCHRTEYRRKNEKK